MKKLNFIGTFLFFLTLVIMSCSASTVTITRGTGMPLSGSNGKPIVAIKVIKNGNNIIPQEDRLQQEGFKDLLDITNQNFNIPLNADESIQIYAEVFGGTLPGGGLSYFNNKTELYRVTATGNENFEVKINLSNKNIQFQTIRTPIPQESNNLEEQTQDLEDEEMTEDSGY